LKKTILLFVLVLMQIVVLAQYKANKSMMYGKKHSDIFPDAYNIEYKGWYFSPGVTFMMPQTFSLVKSIITNNNQLPTSKTGIFLEVGRYKLFEYYTWFRFMDYGIAYKSLRGGEIATGEKFGHHFISGHVNLNNTINMSKYSYIGNTLGINLDYGFAGNNTSSATSLVAQLHYKFSFGYMASKRLLVIPSVETPILNFYPFYYGTSTLTYLSSRYRPIIISLRFLFLKTKKDFCPPVYNPANPQLSTPQN
jgi:hypothetical protein